MDFLKDNLKKAISAFQDNNLKFSIDKDDLFSASIDNSRFSVMPDCVVYASSGNDIASVLKIASEFEVYVTTRGSGTGCCGGCVPISGGIVLDVSAINFIEIDAVARIAHVGAGAITAEVDAQAQKFGLFYPPDPSSHKYSSIGGNIACNAGGLRALKYGCTRENVLALQAYLADGTKLNCSKALKKVSVGQNLRDFFIGSEGTLGVVSEAWLRLLPKPATKKAAIVFFESDKQGFQGIERLMLSALTPEIAEFMDTETVQACRKRFPDLDIPDGKCALLVEFDGDTLSVEADLDSFMQLMKIYSPTKATSAQHSEKLWQIRRKCSPAMYELGDSKVNQDIVLPIGAVEEFFAYYKDLGVKFNLPTPVFGHIGDGNYHIHFMYNGADLDAKKRAKEAMDLSIKMAIQLGGVVSGEHGIGFIKSKYMDYQHGQNELILMRKIKNTFDPKGILNPQKVYQVTDFSSLEPLKGVKLPWD